MTAASTCFAFSGASARDGQAVAIFAAFALGWSYLGVRQWRLGVAVNERTVEVRGLLFTRKVLRSDVSFALATPDGPVLMTNNGRVVRIRGWDKGLLFPEIFDQTMAWNSRIEELNESLWRAAQREEHPGSPR
jgi:hypothetical protein